jgi:nicotinate phosphoribosyltransferase
MRVRPGEGAFALFTDQYELSMLQSYRAEGMDGLAVFSLFVRRLPPTRNYLLACGLETVLDYLEELRFTPDDLAYLRRIEQFSPDFLEALTDFRFEGDVFAVPEGTPVFANEPILEVEAPISQAQMVETFVMNQVHLATVLASKAARVVDAADGRAVVDFGSRRMHGIDAALKAARAFSIAGLDATSNLLAGSVYGVPVSGTMAHSFIQAHGSEMDAFRAFARQFPATILLVDTYDTLDGVQRVIELSRELGEAFRVRGVRLDSGDLGGPGSMRPRSQG